MIEQAGAYEVRAPSQPLTWPLTTLRENQRRLLEMLKGVGPRGCPEAVLLASGFDIELLTGLVRAGLAIVATETVRAGDRTRAVANVRITDAGRRAIEN
jgi:hypothetical protein